MTPSDDLPALLGTLVHLSRRIGQDPRLVQPGGGNTSLKTDGILLVKGSGTDLRTIGPDGFTRLDLARLGGLRETEAMTDAEMMRFMAGCMLADGPAPSNPPPGHRRRARRWNPSSSPQGAARSRCRTRRWP